MTSSIGLAIGNSAATRLMEVDDLIQSADMALLAAKLEGRNQVTIGQTAA